MNRKWLDELHKRQIYLENLIEEQKEKLLNAPEGKLRISHQNNYPRYYHKASSVEKKEGQYIDKNHYHLAHELAQKEYDEKILECAENELKALIVFIKKCERASIEEIYTNLSKSRRMLINPITLPDNEYLEDWLALKYEKKPFAENESELFTNKGDRVRSKSELIIANALFKYGIPYRYEFPLVMNGIGRVYPDFMVLNVRLRKEYYWEHLGMMDDAEYAEKAVKKINSYMQNGYFPGDKLILTQETRKNPISTRQIERIIQQYLR